MHCWDGDLDRLEETLSCSRNVTRLFELQASHSKYRRRTRPRLHEKDGTTSLLELAVRAVAGRVHNYDIDALPADLAQLVLDELVFTSSLNEDKLALFSKQHIYTLKLEESVGVEDHWLGHLARSPLLHVSLASCSEVMVSFPACELTLC